MRYSEKQLQLKAKWICFWFEEMKITTRSTTDDGGRFKKKRRERNEECFLVKKDKIMNRTK